MRIKKACTIVMIVICIFGCHCLETMATSTPTINDIVDNLKQYVQGEKTARLYYKN